MDCRGRHKRESYLVVAIKHAPHGVPAKKADQSTREGQVGHEENKVSFIVQSNTRVQPDTVMIVFVATLL